MVRRLCKAVAGCKRLCSLQHLKPPFHWKRGGLINFGDIEGQEEVQGYANLQSLTFCFSHRYIRHFLGDPKGCTIIPISTFTAAVFSMICWLFRNKDEPLHLHVVGQNCRTRDGHPQVFEIGCRTDVGHVMQDLRQLYQVALTQNKKLKTAQFDMYNLNLIG